MKYLLIIIALLGIGCYTRVENLKHPVLFIWQDAGHCYVSDGDYMLHKLRFGFVGLNNPQSQIISSGFEIGDTIILPNGKWNLK
jgi:hypothetical protein